MVQDKQTVTKSRGNSQLSGTLCVCLEKIVPAVGIRIEEELIALSLSPLLVGLVGSLSVPVVPMEYKTSSTLWTRCSRGGIMAVLNPAELRWWRAILSMHLFLQILSSKCQGWKVAFIRSLHSSMLLLSESLKISFEEQSRWWRKSTPRYVAIVLESLWFSLQRCILSFCKSLRGPQVEPRLWSSLDTHYHVWWLPTPGENEPRSVNYLSISNTITIKRRQQARRQHILDEAEQEEKIDWEWTK